MAAGNMSLPPNLTQQHIQEVFQVRRLAISFSRWAPNPYLSVYFLRSSPLSIVFGNVYFN